MKGILEADHEWVEEILANADPNALAPYVEELRAMRGRPGEKFLRHQVAYIIETFGG